MSWRCVAAALVVLSLGAMAPAGEKPARTSPPAGSTEQIDKLIQQLDSDRFGRREAATNQLQTLGKPAVAALRKAAVGDSLEVTSRAIDILHKLFESPDAATKAAAQEALEEIVKSGHSGAAPRAVAALKPKPTPAENGAGAIQIGGGQLFLGGPNAMGAQIIVGANVVVGGGTTKRVTTSNMNGVKEIQAEENDRKVKIRQEANGRIKMEVVTTKNGKEVTKKYEAQNADELKKKNPQAHDLYKQYNSDQAGGVITINAIGGAAGPGNALNLQFQAGGGALAQPIHRNSVDSATAVLKGMGTHLSHLTEKGNLEAASKESRLELKKQLGQLQRQLAELDKRLTELPDKPAASTPAQTGRAK